MADIHLLVDRDGRTACRQTGKHDEKRWSSKAITCAACLKSTAYLKRVAFEERVSRNLGLTETEWKA